MSAIIMQQMFNGLVIGMVYALVAAGLALVFGVLDIINFSHGEFYMIGAYGLFVLMSKGLPYVPAAFLAVLITAVIGYIFAVSVVRPASRLDSLNSMLATFAMSILLANLAQMIFSPTPRMVASPFQAVIQVGPVFMTGQKIIVILMGILANAFLYWFIHHTLYGKMIWATSEQKVAAEIVGIETKRIYDFAFTIGAAMAAISGILVSSLFSIFPLMGTTIITKVFAIIILGGMGSIPGAIFAGLLLGLAESMGTMVIPSQWSPAIAFVILVLVLLIKPEGVLGKAKGVRI